MTDYAKRPDIIFRAPESVMDAKAQALIAASWAAAAALSAQAAALEGGTYASTGAGEAATTTGQYFWVAGSGTLTRYVRTGGGSTLVATLPYLDPATGRLGVGTSTPAKLFSVSDDNNNGFEVAPDEGDYTRVLSYNRTANWYTPLYIEGDSVRILTGTSAANGWNFNAAGVFGPMTDNAFDAASASLRIKTIHLVNSPSVTSDEREKDWRGPPNEAELRAAKRIIAELGFYQWKSEPDGPLRFGAKAQAVRDILADEGLLDGNPARYGLIDHHEWIDGETDEPRDRYSICTDQLALFLLAAQEVRLLALEAAL